MSEESVGGILRHKDTRHVQVRLDYMLLYRNETKAKIIRIMETWTNQKRAEWYKESLDSKEQGAEPPVEELWITMSYEQFSLFAYGTMKHDNIKRNVDALVAEKHLLRRMHPTIPYGSPQYLLNIKLLQEALDEQDMPSLVDDIGKIAPPRKKHTPPEKYPQGRGLNTPRVGGKIPPAGGEKSYPSNNTSKNHLESPKKEGTVASLPNDATPASLIDFTEEKKKRTDPALPAVTFEDEDDTPTEKVPVVKIGGNDGHSDSPSDSRAFHYRGGPARLAAPAIPTVAGHQERVEAHRANDGAGTHRSLSDAARGQTSFQVEPAVADPPVGTRQAAPGLRITHAPTSKSVAQATLPEPKPQTRKQVESQEVRRESEIWARVERKLETTFSRSQRKSAKNKRGMERLLEDEITDEKIELALDRLTEWEINNFDLERFHELLPGKTAKHRSSQQNGKPTNSTVSKKSTDVNDYSITALLKRQAAAQG